MVHLIVLLFVCSGSVFSADETPIADRETAPAALPMPSPSPTLNPEPAGGPAAAETVGGASEPAAEPDDSFPISDCVLTEASHQGPIGFGPCGCTVLEKKVLKAGGPPCSDAAARSALATVCRDAGGTLLRCVEYQPRSRKFSHCCR